MYSKSQLFLCVYLVVTLTITGLCKLNLIILAHLPVDSISVSRMSPLKLALIGIHVGSLSGIAMDTRWNFGSVEGKGSFVIDFNRVRSSSREWSASHTDVHTGLGVSDPLCWLMTKKMSFSADLPPSPARILSSSLRTEWISLDKTSSILLYCPPQTSAPFLLFILNHNVFPGPVQVLCPLLSLDPSSILVCFNHSLFCKCSAFKHDLATLSCKNEIPVIRSAFLTTHWFPHATCLHILRSWSLFPLF